MIKLLSIFCTISVMLTLIFLNPMFGNSWLYWFAGTSLVLILMLISHLFFRSQNFLFRAHIILHVVPLIYVWHEFGRELNLFTHAIYVVPFMLFFYTGMRAWGHLFARTSWKPYKLFDLGNRQFLLLVPLVFLLEVIFPGPKIASFYQRILFIYCAGHFLLLGLVVPRIGKDV